MPAAIIAIIEVLTAAFSRIMASQAGRWVLNILLFFGVSFVSNKITTAVAMPALQSAFSGMGATTLQWVAFLNVDRAISIVLSAWATVASLNWSIKHVTTKAIS